MNNQQKGFWYKHGWVVAALLCLATYAVLQSTWLMDTLKGWGYEPDAKVAAMVADLELTDTGWRILKATRPIIEGSTEFNEHCNSHNAEISLLGCYIDGRIYIYEIELPQLAAANKVTVAHELLHAAWERMEESERREVSDWLGQVYQDQREWFDGELEVYADESHTEEIYTRAGTKVADLPNELEQHYAKFFQNRAAIVQFYQDYETPFLTLKLEMADLADEIGAMGQEIETERTNYLQNLEDLDARIEKFNACAETAGCFARQSDFERQRQSLLSERTNLEDVRTELNKKIEQNNQRVQDYRERQLQLGELNNAMNSNIELIEVLK